jgi:hypothetical protein
MGQLLLYLFRWQFPTPLAPHFFNTLEGFFDTEILLTFVNVFFYSNDYYSCLEVGFLVISIHFSRH